MNKHERMSPSGQLRSSNRAVAEAFQSFRDSARKAGPLDVTTVELILLAGFGAAGHEEPFKNHASRALKAGIAKAALQQAVVVTLGATSVLPSVAKALGWIDEVCERDRTAGEP